MPGDGGLRALIFDCDGVLADTERDGHLPAYNATFREFGLPLAWTEAEYGERLAIAGGKERLATVLTPEVVRAWGLPSEDGAIANLIERLHERKTRLFSQRARSGALPPRPGIARVAHAAAERGWKLAVASTSALESVRAVLAAAVGEAFAQTFEIYAGDVVRAKKPAPDIYLAALAGLDVSASRALVIEDSRLGLRAATAAGLRCLVTLSTYTQREVMDDAILVVSSLGDPGAAPVAVRENRSGRAIGAYVTSEDIAAIADARRVTT